MAEEEFDDFAQFEEELKKEDKVKKKPSKVEDDLESELDQIREDNDQTIDQPDESEYEEVMNTPNLGVVRRRGRPMKEERQSKPIEGLDDVPTIRRPVQAPVQRQQSQPRPLPARRPVQVSEPEPEPEQQVVRAVQSTRVQEEVQPRYAPLIMPSRYVAFDTETKTALTEAPDIESLKVQLLFEILNRIDKLEKAF